MKPVDRLRAALLVFLGFAGALAAMAQQPRAPGCIPAAAAAFFQRRAPDTACFATLPAIPIHRNSNLLVVVGSGRKWCSKGRSCGVSRRLWWNPRDLLGLFLQDRENPDRVHELTMVRTRYGDALLEVERLTEKEILLKEIPEKGALARRRFLFDAAAKRFHGQARYRVFRAAGVAGGRGAPQFVLRGAPREDLSAPILVFRPADGGGFEPVPESAWAPEIDGEFGNGWSDASGPLRFGPEGRFSVETVEDEHRRRKAIGVREGDDLYPLPVSDAERRKRGSESEAIEEAIGHRQVFAGRLWFGKTFYDAEGYTGVGGFGYFDPQTRRYVIFSPPAVRGWSVSALLVEKDTVWLGLQERGEWGGASGGLLRWDRAGRPARLFDTPLVGFIARWRGGLYLGTAEGLAVVEGNRVESYIVVRELDGGFELVRRVILNRSGELRPVY